MTVDLAGLTASAIRLLGDYGWALAKILTAAGVGYLVHAAIFLIASPVAKRSGWVLGEALLTRLKRPSRLMFPLLGVQTVIPTLTTLSPPQLDFVRHVFSLGFIAVNVWLVLSALAGVEGYVKQIHRVDVQDNYAARRIHTQVTVLTRLLGGLVILIAVAAALMTFPRVKEFGQGLLASAGLVGLVAGLAARPFLENFIAGLQIALTQPVNIDDVVIIEGEWGWVEEITPTYVVVKIWDQRRLIVPFSKFIQEPFQNWTRRTSEILGTVFIHADYTLPVQAVREELSRIVHACDLWDRRVCVLQVTDATERTIQLRALVSAANSPAAWDLRVHVREKLIAFLQREYPHCLPRIRHERSPEKN